MDKHYGLSVVCLDVRVKFRLDEREVAKLEGHQYQSVNGMTVYTSHVCPSHVLVVISTGSMSLEECFVDMDNSEFMGKVQLKPRWASHMMHRPILFQTRSPTPPKP